MSLKEALAKLFEIKILLQNNIDPKVQQTIPDSVTFKILVNEWMDKQKHWTQKHHQLVKYRLERFAFPHIGDQSVTAILPKDILNFLRNIENVGKFETAKIVLALCSQAFRYAVACGYCQHDPCSDLKGALTSVKSTKRAALTDPKDVAIFMQNIFNYPRQDMRNALLFSAYTFCRPGEIRHAEWIEIDFENKIWRIPAEKMKMRKEHRVPLASQCIKILEEMKYLNQKWVFPSPKAGKPMSEAGVLSAIRNMGYDKHEMCAHGFRSMASTLLNEQGYKADLIEKALAHGDDNNIRGIYNRTDYFEERRLEHFSNALRTVSTAFKPIYSI